MRWIRAALIPVATVLLGAAPVPKHLMPKEELYWPTAVGTKWVYEQNGNEYPEEIITADIEQKGTTVTVRRGQGDWIGHTVYAVAHEKVTLQLFDDMRLERLVARFPLKRGDSWEVKFPAQEGPQGESGKAMVGESEEITVPAGKFQATKVVFTATKLGDTVLQKPLVTTFWYASGVGLVQCETAGGILKLKSFTPGKK